MGAMQRMLERLLGEVGAVSHGTLRTPRPTDLEGCVWATAVDAVYRQLGGRRPHAPLRPGGWDLEFNGVAVELDEYLHFNRYRAMTLESQVYGELPAFPLAIYRGHCADHEDRCLRAGSYKGKWSNPSSESQFGPKSEPGDLSGGGAPRWKQRAFYDFVKDLSPLLVHVRLVRLSVWA